MSRRPLKNVIASRASGWPDGQAVPRERTRSWDPPSMPGRSGSGGTGWCVHLACVAVCRRSYGMSGKITCLHFPGAWWALHRGSEHHPDLDGRNRDWGLRSL